jgi:hypothetical protein
MCLWVSRSFKELQEQSRPAFGFTQKVKTRKRISFLKWVPFKT